MNTARHEPCNAYCAEDIHCIETLATPGCASKDIWRDQETLWYIKEVVDVRPATECDVGQWRALIATARGRVSPPEYSTPWFVFARLKETEHAAS